MTFAAAFKRFAAIVAVVAAGLAAVILSLPALLPAERVRVAALAEIARSTGLTVEVGGAVSVSMFPQFAVTLSDLRIAASGDGEAPVVADAAIGSVRLLPLIAGRIVIGDLTLVRPRVTLRRDPEGRSNWDGAIQALRSLASADASATLPGLRIIDGRITIHDAARDWEAEAAGADLSIAWPGGARQATLSGRFIARGEALDLSAVIADPAALIAGKESAVKARLSGAPVRLGFDGRAAISDAPHGAGVVTIEGASLRSLLRFIGHETGRGATLGPFAVKGEARFSAERLAFERGSVELDGNVAEGVVSLAFSGSTLRIQATLDAGRFVATTYFADWPLRPGPAEGWSRQPIDLSIITSSDIDVRLSARETVIGGATLGRTGASIVSRGGRLTVTLGEAIAYGGLLRGVLVLTPVADGAQVRASLSAQRVQIGQGLGEWFGFRRLNGTANAQVSLEARGATMDAVVRSATGEATLTAIDGHVAGLNAEAILRRLERRPLAAAGADARSGRTPFDRFAASARIAGGVATTTDVTFDGPNVKVTLDGAARLQARELDMTGVALLKRGAEPGFELPFIVQGSWDDPFVLPDPQSLIRRSGAAAPLRDVTRDRDALRAVLDAINRRSSGETDTVETGPARSFAPTVFPPLPPRP